MLFRLLQSHEVDESVRHLNNSEVVSATQQHNTLIEPQMIRTLGASQQHSYVVARRCVAFGPVAVPEGATEGSVAIVE